VSENRFTNPRITENDQNKTTQKTTNRKFQLNTSLILKGTAGALALLSFQLKGQKELLLSVVFIMVKGRPVGVRFI